MSCEIFDGPEKEERKIVYEDDFLIFIKWILCMEHEYNDAGDEDDGN